ncbi:MAG: ABC transporter permease [Pseudomonadota bacterium]
MNDLTLIRKGVFRKKVRATLLILSILVAFLIFGVLGAVNAAFGAGVDTAAANRLVTVNKINFTLSMPYAYYGRVRQVDGVENVTHANWFGGYYQEPRNFVQSFAVEPATYLAAYPELQFGEGQAEAFINTRDCLAVGADLLTQFEDWELGRRIPVRSNIWRQQDGSDTWEFEICAVFDGEQDNVPANYAFFHYEYYNEALQFGSDEIGWMVINTTDPSVNDQVIADIDEMFVNSRAESETTTEGAFNQAFVEQFGNIGMILTLVISAAFATILMIVGTTMFLAISERTREIAVLKTLGFSQPRIFTHVLSESVLLSLIGGLIGLGLAALFVSVAAAALSAFLPGLSMSTETILTAVAIMIGFGLITGLVPAINAMRVQIVDGLSKS